MLKRKKFIIGLVALLIVLNSALVTEVNAATNSKKVTKEQSVSTNKKKMKVVSKTLSIRKGASTKQKVIAKVKKGTELTAIGNISSSWVKVEYKGKTGYAYSKDLQVVKKTSDKSETKNKVTVLSNTLTIRKGASSKQKSIAKVKKGTKLTAIGSISSSWVKVEYKGQIGYVYNKNSNCLKKVSDSNAVEAAVKNVIKAIDNISSTVSLDDKDQITKARVAYNKLSSSSKKKVTNISKLKKAESRLQVLLSEQDSVDNSNNKLDKENTSTNAPSTEGNNVNMGNDGNIGNADNLGNEVDIENLPSGTQDFDNSGGILESSESNSSESKKYQEMANVVINQIAKLNKEIQLEDAELIQQIRNDYENLPQESKTLVYNIEVLKEAELKLVNLKNEYAQAKKAVESYQEELDKLPNVSEVKLSDKNSIVLVRSQYERLNTLAKSMISPEVNDKLVDLENVIKALEIEEQDKANALYVEGLINKLDKTIVYEDYSLIKEARTQYNQLSKYAKSLVGNLAILEKAEMLHAKVRENVSKVINLINGIPTTITLKDKDYVVSVREAYEQLSVDEKKAIMNTELSILINAEEKIDRLETTSKHEVLIELSKQVNSLPSKEEITIDYKDQIAELKEQYYLIDESIRYAVGEEFTVLCELEAQIKLLELQK